MTPNSDLPNNSNLDFVERLYADYVCDSASVAPEWRHYFETLHPGDGRPTAPRFGPSFRPASIFNPPAGGNGAGVAADRLRVEARQDRLDQLIRAYRVRGHMMAKLDPLGLPRPDPPELDPAHYGFTDADLDDTFSSRTMGGPARPATGYIRGELTD